MWTKVYLGDEPVRINKWLAQSGVCSRRDADALIAQGSVALDGATVTEAGARIAPGQTLTLNREAREVLGAQGAYVLHKPIGYVSGQPEKGQVPAVRLLTPANRFGGEGEAPAADRALPPLGRLDMDSRGLLLLSDDGVLAKAIIGPDSSVDKEYAVAVTGQIDARKLDLLREGLSLDGRRLKRALVERTGKDRLRFVLREGRNRQIRRMCALVGLEVVDLLRLRIGPLELGALPEGRWRALTAEERKALIGR